MKGRIPADVFLFVISSSVCVLFYKRGFRNRQEELDVHDNAKREGCGNSHKDEFPTAGIKISFVTGDLITLLGGIKELEGLTTEQVCKQKIIPMTSKEKSSFCDILKKQGHPAFVDKAGAFISHAHGYTFLDLLSALEWRFRDEPDTSVWIDLFSINQHKPLDWTFEWLSTTFKGNIANIGRTVMVMSPWDNPLPYTRAWCIFEAYSTVDANCEFDIALSKNDEATFLREIKEDPEEKINKILITIRAEKSECSVESDKQAIFKVIRDTVGFSRLDSMVFERYREWVIEVTLDALRACDDGVERVGLLGVLGVLYLGQGQYKKAETCGFDFLETSTATLGKDHPNSLTAMNNLALALEGQGKHGDAEELHRQCLDRRTAVLGENHCETLVTMNNLAVACANQEKYVEAEELYRLCLRRQKAISPASGDNPKTLRTMNNLAAIFERQEQYSRAENLYKKCLAKRKILLDEDHPDTLLAMHNLAGFLASQGSDVEAEEMYDLCLEKRKAILGQEHPETLVTTDNFAGFFFDQGKYAKAADLYQSCLEWRKAVLEPGHPEILQTESNLALTFENIKRLPKSSEIETSNEAEDGNPESAEANEDIYLFGSKIFKPDASTAEEDPEPDNAGTSRGMSPKSSNSFRMTDEAQAADGANNPLPKCFCNWKRCRTYQKALREYKRVLYNGVVKLKFFKSNRKSMTLKASVDRTLHVESAKRNDWKTIDGEPMCRYYVARHHFTEALMKQYLADRRAWDWNEPLTMKQAKTFLWSLDFQDVYYSEDEEEDEDDDEEDTITRYVQSPNVPEEPVREMLKRHQELSCKDSALAQKEEEILRLRLQLNACQEQLSMLHSMVKQLKVDMDRTRTSDKKNKKENARESSSAEEDDDDDPQLQPKEDSAIGGSEVPLEIYFSGDEVDDEEDMDGDDCDEEESVSSGEESDYRIEESTRSRSSARSIHSRRSVRRGSVLSRRDSSSIHSRRSRSSSRHSKRSIRGDASSVASQRSLQSSVSLPKASKTLPREIELSSDDEESEHFFDDSYRKPDHDSRSVGSRSAASQASRRSVVSRSRGRNTRQPGQPESKQANAKQPQRGDGSAVSVSRDSSVPREIDLSGDELEDDTYADANIDILFVTDKQIVDPYGEKGVYTGALSKSTYMPNGKGRLEYEKVGRWYEGDWIHGRWTGYGRLNNGDGDFYEGGLKNDHKHGQGIMSFADGRIFEGEYIRGQMIQGKMTYQDGSVYAGSWVDGLRHGRGKCIFVDGSEYEGEFREGTFHGHGKMTWNDGGWYIGEWCDGEMHGRGKEIHPDGTIRHDGEWSRGQPVRATHHDSRRRQLQAAAPAGVSAS